MMSDTAKHARRKKTLNRINRIQGQLTALKTAIEADTECEQLVIQAHSVEKAMKSLIIHMVGGYFEHQAKDLIQDNPDEALEALQRLFELSHR
ncbi:MAG: hypothetical protein Phog2KO_45460 [Phototrophicaceae bacterium]